MSNAYVVDDYWDDEYAEEDATGVGTLSDADISRIAAAVLAAMQASPPPTNTVAVKGDTSIQPWPTATQNAEAVWSKELP